MARSYFVLVKTGMLHDLENKALKQPVEHLVNAVNILLSMHNRAQMRIIGDLIYINDTPLSMDDGLFTHVRKMSKLTETLKLREITFTQAIENGDLYEMVEHIKIAQSREDGAGYISGLDLHKVILADCDQERRELPQKQQSLHAYLVALLTIKDLVTQIQSDKASRVAPVKRAMQHLVSMTYADPALMLGLIKMPRYKNRLFSHLLNTAVLTIVFCERIDADKNLAANIAFTAALHDLDWRGHGDRLMTIRELLRIYKGDRHGQARLAILADLDKPDGSSIAQLISVAARYEDLTAEGEDGEPVLPDEALRRIQQEVGTRFHGTAVKLLSAAVGVFPVGSAVELSDGSLGVVIELPADQRLPDSPIVKRLKNANGSPANSQIIDLHQQSDLRIIKTVQAQELNFNVCSVFLA